LEKITYKQDGQPTKWLVTPHDLPQPFVNAAQQPSTDEGDFVK
jgi:hypothetical protein